MTNTHAEREREGECVHHQSLRGDGKRSGNIPNTVADVDGTSSGLQGSLKALEWGLVNNMK